MLVLTARIGSSTQGEGMHFSHASEIWRDYPELVPGVLWAEGITGDRSTDPQVAKFHAIAKSRLATSPEGELPEIKAWRRAFSRMGLKPTQYRCASESLLRRFRKNDPLPQIHPLVDLCNAVSLAFAIPVAAFDISKIDQYLQVRYATGCETYLAFSGETEKPEVHEIIFADSARRAHARRWTNRQSGLSAVHAETRSVIIVAEAMHEAARPDVLRLTADLGDAIEACWRISPRLAVLEQLSPRFEF